MKNTLNKLLAIAIICVFVFARTNAQQYGQMSQYMFNKMVVNPAFAGNSPVLNVSLDYRKMYMGFEGAPTTQFLTASIPFQLKNMAVGLKVINDKVGVNNSLSFDAIYAFQIGFGKGKLSMALEGGILNSSINYDGLARDDENDDAIPVKKISKLVPNADFGVYYNTDKWYIGATAYHLIQGKIDYSGAGVGEKLATHLFFIAGYNYSMSKDVKLEPSILLKNVKGVPVQLDINAMVDYKNMLSVGVSYRIKDALAIIASFNLMEELRIGYSYDLSMSELKTYHSGTHEIMLSYSYKLPAPPRKKTVDPRYYY